MTKFSSTLIVVAFFLSLITNAQLNATSVQSGDWMNPQTWDCSCIPFPGYNVTINHAVVLDTNYAHIVGAFIIASSGSLQQDGTPRAFAVTGGTMTNNGTLVIDTFVVTGGTLSNNKDIWFDQFANMSTFTNSAGAYLYCDSMTNTATFNNLGVDTALAYMNTGTHVNSGQVRLLNFTNTGTLQNQNFVQAQNFWNTGTTNNYGVINANNYTNSGSHTNGIADPLCELNSANLWNTQNMDNYGIIRAVDLATTGNSFNNDWIILIENNFYTEGAAVNTINGYINVDENYYNGDTTFLGSVSYLINDGDFNIGTNFWNADSIGGSGHICVGQNSVNDGVLIGTFSFCDNTGGGVDFNSGIIGAGVTYCDTAFTCFAPAPINSTGVEQVETDQIKFFPNPANDMVTFKVDSNFELVLYNGLGQLVQTKTISPNSNTLFVNHLTTGIYFLSLKSSQTGLVYKQSLVVN